MWHRVGYVLIGVAFWMVGVAVVEAVLLVLDLRPPIVVQVAVTASLAFLAVAVTRRASRDPRGWFGDPI